jgi:MFS superfamily sulfate permease-like transporter
VTDTRSPSTDPSSTASGPFRFWKQDLLASLVVFLVALPLCMGIALASGAPVSAGLITGIVGGLVVANVAGSPLQVSGPAAGLTVVCGDMIRQHGMPGLGLAVLVAGLIQFAAGVFRLGQWFRAVSPAVIHGMLTGIGILILSSQIHVLVDDRPRENAVQNLIALPDSLRKAFGMTDWESPELREQRIAAARLVNSVLERQKQISGDINRTLVRSFAHEEDQRFPEGLLSESKERQAALIEDWKQAVEQLSTMTIMAPSASSVKPVTSGQDGTTTETGAPESDTPALIANCLAKLTDAEKALSEFRPEIRGSAFHVSHTQKDAAASLLNVLNRIKHNEWAGKVGLIAVIVIIVWSSLARGSMKLIPAPLLAIIISTMAAQCFTMPVLYVDVPQSLLDGITLPRMETIREISFRDITIAGCVLAIIASAETLLCATAVDQMQTGPRTKYDKELRAQGIGNTICGIFGVLPMTGVIVRSAANVQAGGRTRLSAFLHGVWILLFTWELTPLLRLIPTSALAGILVYTGYRLIDIRGFKHLWKSDRGDAFIFLTTVFMIVVEDLLIGVVTGIVLSALRLLLRFSRLEISQVQSPKDLETPSRVTMTLIGSATFLRLPLLAGQLEKIAPGTELYLDLKKLDYIDRACLELVTGWSRQHQATGGKLIVDWAFLHERSGHDRQPVAN